MTIVKTINFLQINVFKNNSKILCVQILPVLVCGYLLKILKLCHFQLHPWYTLEILPTKGTNRQKDKFADAMNHIRIKNRKLYDEIDRKLDTVYINNRKNPQGPTSLASAPYNGNHINIWKPYFIFPSQKTWVNTIFHEFGHMEGQKHGSDHSALIFLRMKSVGY